MLFVFHADDVVRGRGYSDHFVMMCVCGCVCKHDKTKTPDRNDLKLCRSLLILGSNGQELGAQGHHFELLAPAAT